MTVWRRFLVPMLGGALVLAGCLPAGRGPTAEAWRARPAPALQHLLDPRSVPTGRAWLGGDVASSVTLGDGRALWLFGDTLLGHVRHDCPPPLAYCGRDVEGDDAHGMIANSVGIMRRKAGTLPTPLEAAWGGSAEAPGDAIVSPWSGEFLWPMAVARVGDTVVATASRHTRSGGLYSLGSVFLRVRDARGPVDAWQWEVAPTVPSHSEAEGRAQLTWMTALVPYESHLYVFGQRGVSSDAATLLARLPVAALDADTWAPALEFLHVGDDGGARWEDAFDPQRAYAVPGLPGTTEATVHHHPRLGWYSFRIPPLTFEVHLYTAERLEGPWRSRGLVYELPTRWSAPVRPDGHPRYAAYAVKAHPWLGDADAIVLTYNVNLLSGTYETAVDAAETEHGFYVPQVLRVEP